jgi:hypothetical protein
MSSPSGARSTEGGPISIKAVLVNAGGNGEVFSWPITMTTPELGVLLKS